MPSAQTTTFDLALAWVEKANAFIWGPIFFLLIIGVGFYLTFLLRGVQFRRLIQGLRLAFFDSGESGDHVQGDISHFQVLMTSLAATVGIGNIAGVAAAIAVGGPGALFWMWISALVGMATKFAEAALGVRYRVKDSQGEMSGGPAVYLARGVGGRFGRSLGFLYAIFAALASFGIGNMVQSNSVADALRSSFGVSPVWTGAVLAALTALVILGGIKSIGRFASILVPVMLIFYTLGCLVVIAINFRGIPDMFALIFREAFTATAAVGGFTGATVMMAIRMGISRGVFSNEAGLGTGGIVAAAAKTGDSITQALVSMTQTFIDTIIGCSLTAFVIIASGSWTGTDPVTGSVFTGAPLTIEAFNTALPGRMGDYIVSISIALFAYATLLGWSYYGERNVEYLLGGRAILPYRIVFILGVFAGCWVLTLGGTRGFDFVWGFSDMLNGAMAVPNLIGLILLSGVVAADTREYFRKETEAGAEEGR
ncbi:MAG: sodium:alanine symporter family protein [Gemmatimonadota bacterium]|jgi:AGCS family alanine or glycine:cation symporter|nr:sodium:alanine symporter family protein [Gemmatimonadota bacterium]